jgi:putative copper resistance protein D
MSAYLVNVTLHIFAALIWLGGMFFLALVGAPALRTVESPHLRAQLFKIIGERFRTVGWICIAVLLITGLLNLHFRGFLSWTMLGSGNFWGSSYGKTLAVKLIAVTGMLIIQTVHDFFHGPAASRLAPGSEPALRMRRSAALMARVSAILGVIVMLAAVRLTRPG